MADLSFLIQKYQDELYCTHNSSGQLKHYEQYETFINIFTTTDLVLYNM